VSRLDRDKTRTLWLSKDTLLDTRLERAVEQRVEHVVVGRDLVVGLDILLECDAAARKSAKCQRKQTTRRNQDSKLDSQEWGVSYLDPLR
jgi:hypothetical protein